MSKPKRDLAREALDLAAGKAVAAAAAKGPGHRQVSTAWLRAVAAKLAKQQAVLREFCGDVECTGGLVYAAGETQDCLHAAGDWTALAETYKHACQVLGEKPKYGGEDVCIECGTPLKPKGRRCSQCGTLGDDYTDDLDDDEPLVECPSCHSKLDDDGECPICVGDEAFDDDDLEDDE